MSTRSTKRQGQIEKPKGTIKTEREIIKSGNKKFILTKYKTERSITFYLGNKDTYCVDAQISWDMLGNYNEEGYLNKIRWDNTCSLDEDFKEGIDTQLIINLMITYIKNSYPNVKLISFTDLSERKCDNGVNVSLAAMKYLTDGQTWYEHRFKAKIHPLNETNYNVMKERIDKLKKETSWDSFSNRWMNSESIEINMEELRNIYDTSSTWQEFFGIIKNKIGVSKLCIWFSTKNWFKYFCEDFLKFNLFNVKFLLNINEFNQEYQVEENLVGGKRKITRKNR